MEILEAATRRAGREGHEALDGELAFKLHDTYGFPLDLTADVCRERGVTVDEAGFDAAMARQREQARAAGKFKMAQGLEYRGAKTTFHGYEQEVFDDAKVVALYVDGAPVNAAQAGAARASSCSTTRRSTPSAAARSATRACSRNASARVRVEDTLKIQADVFGHHGRVDAGHAQGRRHRRRPRSTRAPRPHRAQPLATHLMHKALREVLGGHVQQKGSLVDADKTRFDFAHNAPMTDEQIRRGRGDRQRRRSWRTRRRSARVMPIDERRRRGAMMLFGEKYGDEVRVLDIGSAASCAAARTCARTGDIGLFKIVSEGGVAAGIRRVEAVTGDNALRLLQELEATRATRRPPR